MVGHALLQPLMSADYHANTCKMKTSDVVACYLPCLSIQFGCTLSIHKFRQIVSVDRDPSQCQQTIGEFVSITRMNKQRSPISIVHRSPVNARHHCRAYVGDTDEAIMSYSTILHSRHFWPCAHVTGSRSAWFHSAI